MADSKRSCKRCGDEEFRIHGYCSLECEHLDDLEEELRDECAKTHITRATARELIAKGVLWGVDDKTGENLRDAYVIADRILKGEQHPKPVRPE